MAALAAFLSRFGELLARQRRILTFRATPEDYQSLGWWDLAWGMTHIWLLTSIGVWKLREAGEPAVPLNVVVDGPAQGLLYVLGLALLRPSRGILWQTVPLTNLTWVLGIFSLLPDLWEKLLHALERGGIPSAVGDLLPRAAQHWAEPVPLHYALLLSWLGILVWRGAILAVYFCQALGLRWVPALMVVLLPELLAEVLRDKNPGFWFFAIFPPLLVYLFEVGRAWWTTARTGQEPVELQGQVG